MISEILPDPSSFQALGWTVVILFSLIGGTNQILRLTDRFKEPAARTNNIHPQPLVVARDKEFVELHFCEAQHEKLDQERKELFSKIGGVERGAAARMEELRREIKSDFVGVHQRMNDIAEEMPKKVIELLKTTGVIK